MCHRPFLVIRLRCYFWCYSSYLQLLHLSISFPFFCEKSSCLHFGFDSGAFCMAISVGAGRQGRNLGWVVDGFDSTRVTEQRTIKNHSMAAMALAIPVHLQWISMFYTFLHSKSVQCGSNVDPCRSNVLPGLGCYRYRGLGSARKI